VRRYKPTHRHGRTWGHPIDHFADTASRQSCGGDPFRWWVGGSAVDLEL
jgi:hypothetical protein